MVPGLTAPQLSANNWIRSTAIFRSPSCHCPELNPVEYLWAWLKRHAIANFCPDNLNELHAVARNKLKSAQHRPSIIAVCWMQATLW